MQRTRRTTPYPFTWEIPVGIVLGVLLALVLGLQAGRSLANLVAGNGWVFVDRMALPPRRSTGFGSGPSLLDSFGSARGWCQEAGRRPWVELCEHLPRP